MRKNMRISGLMAIVMVFALLVGTLAFFTDRVTASASASTMDNAVDIVPMDPGTDPGTSDDTEIPDDPSVATDGLTGFWAANNTARINFNPGDSIDLSYALKNAGTLDVKVRETFVITSSVDLTQNSEQFKLCTAYTTDDNGAKTASTTTGMTFSRIDAKHYKVTVAEATLASGATVDKDFFLIFAPSSSNSFQGATCTVEYLVEAMQSDGSWTTAATGSVTMGGQTVSAVPAA